ncbi:hypothetical protein K3767_05540 [Thermosulfurimonas sp. F29]|nr:hypothetical protein [Thermosulfurimonas sp. F29]
MIELLVVMALLVVLAGFGLSGIQGVLHRWFLKRDLERIYASLKEAQRLAFVRKRACGVWFGGETFDTLEIRCDASSPLDEDIEDRDDLRIKVINLRNTFQHSLRSRYILFKPEGFTSNLMSICPEDNGTLTVRNCIKINRVRISFGTWSGGPCNDENCR